MERSTQLSMAKSTTFRLGHFQVRKVSQMTWGKSNLTSPARRHGGFARAVLPQQQNLAWATRGATEIVGDDSDVAMRSGTFFTDMTYLWVSMSNSIWSPKFMNVDEFISWWLVSNDWWWMSTIINMINGGSMMMIHAHHGLMIVGI